MLEAKDLGELKGTVTFNGKPVVFGAIQFFTDKEMSCVAFIERDGSYHCMMAPGNFKVAIVTMIEPKHAMQWAKEGPPGAPKGGPPGPGGPGGPGGPKGHGGKDPKGSEVYDRMPTLAKLLEGLSADERSTLETVQTRYGSIAETPLTLTVERGSNKHDFDLK
jgi:hypothetical protein